MLISLLHRMYFITLYTTIYVYSDFRCIYIFLILTIVQLYILVPLYSTRLVSFPLDLRCLGTKD